MTAPPEATVSGRPIVSLTLALNYGLAPTDARDVMVPDGPLASPYDRSRFYRNVWGYHALNIAIHIAATLALFGIVRRTLHSPRLRAAFAAAATPLAFVVALIWAVHPLHTESVAYVVQRAESLMGMFWMLTIYCAIRTIEAAKGASGGNQPKTTGWLAAAVSACALGMATKESMVAAPLIVVIWAWLFDPTWRKRGLLFAGLAATWLVLVALVLLERRPASVGFALGIPWWVYLRTQSAVIVHYLQLSFWPSPGSLVFDYGWPPARSWTDVAPQFAFVVALVTGSVALLIRRHPIGLLGAWCLLALAPTSSVLPIVTEIAAEHRMYVPLAALVAGVVVGSYRLLRSYSAMTGIGVSAAVVIALGVITLHRNDVYSSEEALWLDTVQKRPDNARAHMGYGSALQLSQRFAEAEQEFRAAIRLEPNGGGLFPKPKAHMNLGAVLSAQGKLDEGIAQLTQAIALDPNQPEAYGLLGEAYAGRGDRTRAIEYFTRAVQLLPGNALLRDRLKQLQGR